MAADRSSLHTAERVAGPRHPDAPAGTPSLAGHQPQWEDPVLAAGVRATLSGLPGLVGQDEVQVLRRLLAEVADGRRLVVQAGDCAEDPAESSARWVGPKAGLLEALAAVMTMNTGLPVIRAGRMGGQFAKPRSESTEHEDGVEVPTFRGHLVNGPEATPGSRRFEPTRMLQAYEAAARVTTLLRERPSATPPSASTIWTSHEALILDYELPLVRPTGPQTAMLSSTHWPWLGYRTRHPGGAHVRMLAGLDNPVACKVGPATTPEELVTLCGLLDPGHEPGRLTFIARMGADRVAELLPPLVAAVRAANFPVIWLCDPMHGNTTVAANGLKTRYVDTVIREVLRFQAAVAVGGGVAGGLHLEATPFRVAECVAGAGALPGTGELYTTLCDPRLNAPQALQVTAAWGDPASEAGW